MLYFITILIAICQATLANVIAVGNIKPDLPLILVIFVAINKGPFKAATVGILAGFLKDVLSAGVFINTFSMPAYGILVGIAAEKFYFVRDRLPVQFLITLAVCLLDAFVRVFYFANWDYPPPAAALIFFIGIPGVLYTLFAGVLFFLCGSKYSHS